MSEEVIKTTNDKFLQSWLLLSERVHKANRDKGFWENEENPLFAANAVALIASEVFEAYEILHKGKNPQSEKIPDFLHVEEELADVLIRLLDFAGGKGYRVAEAALAKLEYNKTRPHKHGKAF